MKINIDKIKNVLNDHENAIISEQEKRLSKLKKTYNKYLTCLEIHLHTELKDNDDIIKLGQELTGIIISLNDLIIMEEAQRIQSDSIMEIINYDAESLAKSDTSC